MAVTEAALQTSIQAKGYESDSATAQAEAIKSVWRRVTGLRRWKHLEASGTATATVGNEVVSLAGIADIGPVDAVRAAFGSDTYALEFEPAPRLRDWIRELAATDTGAPDRWSKFAGSLLLYPRPNRAYVLTVDYIKLPTYAAGAIVFPDVYQDVLVWGAITEMAFRQREYTAASYAQGQYEQRLTEMIREDGLDQRQSTLEVGRSDFWSEAAG